METKTTPKIDEKDFDDIREDRGDAYYRIGWKCLICKKSASYRSEIQHGKGCKYAKANWNDTMQSKNITKAEREWMASVKSLQCGLCGNPPISEAHHIEQGKHFITIPLCRECHTGPMGWHGDKRLWKIYKKDQIDVLNDTLRKLYGRWKTAHIVLHSPRTTPY